jgi:hypothetical protein
LHGLAQLLASAGRLGEAERCNEEALAIAVAHGERHVELRTRLLRFRLQVDLRRMSAATPPRRC